METTHFTYDSHSEADTERLGQALARELADGAVLALNGPLGAGKTRLVQSLVTACGVERGDVVSPTFVLMHEYHGRQPIYHLDAYRLRDDDEFLQLGVDEYYGPPNLVLVEWAERVERCLPEERIDVAISVVDGQRRKFEIAGHGTQFATAVSRLKGALT